MSPAVIFFEFDPIIENIDRAVSLWSLLVVVAVLLALAGAAFLAGRSRADDARPLSQVDLWMLVLGAVPGAVIGGRIGYALLHVGYYGEDPGAIVDAAEGAFQLSLAIVCGALTGAYVARIIEAPLGRWLHVAAIPVFGIVVVGKVAMALGGAGQGSLSTDPWATAYLGDGPWGSLAPALPAQPAQLFEAGLTFLVLGLVVGVVAAGGFRRHDGLLFLATLEAWIVARFVVAFTWRDPAILGPLNADQLISLAILAGCLVLHAVWIRRRGPAGSAGGSDTTGGAPEDATPEIAWPEASTAGGWRRGPGAQQ